VNIDKIFLKKSSFLVSPTCRHVFFTRRDMMNMRRHVGGRQEARMVAAWSVEAKEGGGAVHWRVG
jgi:hypothetical protein